MVSKQTWRPYFFLEITLFKSFLYLFLTWLFFSKISLCLEPGEPQKRFLRAIWSWVVYHAGMYVLKRRLSIKADKNLYINVHVRKNVHCVQPPLDLKRFLIATATHGLVFGGSLYT